MRFRPRVWALALVLLLPTSALAGPAEDLEEGLRLYDDLEYEDAIPKLEAAKDAPSLPKARRAQAAVTLGTIQLVLGEEDAARQAFTEALTLDRDLELPPSASPKIQEMVAEVRANLPPEELEPPPPPPTTPPPSAGPLLRHDPPPPGKGPTTLTFNFAPARTIQIADVRVFYRTAGESLWFDKNASPSGLHAYTVEIPGPGEARSTEYYAEVTDISGNVVAQAGSAAVPLAYERLVPTQAVAPVVEKPIHEQWWLWAGVGALVVGGVAAGIALSAGGGCNAPDGEGCLRVGVE